MGCNVWYQNLNLYFYNREALLKSCWQRTPSLRPQAAEIVEILTDNSRLIQPCVGIPSSSIQLEGSNSLELPLAPVCKNKGNFIASKMNNFDLPLNLMAPNGKNINEAAQPTQQPPPLTTNSQVTQYITLQHANKDQDRETASPEPVYSLV